MKGTDSRIRQIRSLLRKAYTYIEVAVLGRVQAVSANIDLVVLALLCEEC